MKIKFSLAAVFLCIGIAWGQSTFATITGLVSDPTGAVIPGATIEATQTQKNYTYSATSNEVGQYTLANLSPGTYTLAIKAPGFQDFLVGNIILEPRENRRIDSPLKVGSAGTSVEVTAGAGLIETESARISNIRGEAALKAMPLSMRRTWDFMTLTPQVDKTAGAWQFKFAGSKASQGDAQLDGTTLTASSNTPIGPLMDKTEGIQEMRIDIAQGSAESAAIGQITMISRSGSNDLHGSVSDYYETPGFRARSPFQSSKDSQRLHTLAIAGGGPVYIPKIYNGKDRTFFFTTIEFVAGTASGSSFNRGVPLESWRNGDFSTWTSAIKDPFNGNLPFSGNIIPVSRLSNVAKVVQDRFLPLPNYGDPRVFQQNNYRELRLGNFTHQPTLVNRIDHRFSDKMFIFGRWTATRWVQDYPGGGAPTLKELTYSRRNMDALSLALTRTITPNLLNEFRYGLTTQRSPIHGPVKGKALVEELGLQGLAPNLPDVYGMPTFTWSGISIGGLNSKVTCDPCNQEYGHSFTNAVSWFRGKHSFKFGGNAKQGSYDKLDYGNIFGTAAFSGRFTGQAYADFMLGLPTSTSRDYPGVLTSTQRWSQGYYVTDEWRVTPRVTVSMGLRWDLYTPATEANNRLAMFDVASGGIVVPDGASKLVSPLMPAGYVSVIEASKAGRPSKSLIYADKNNFQPRVAVAWRPFDNKTVFRGGFGIYYNQDPAGASSGSTVPFVINQPSYTNPTTNPIVFPVFFPGSGTSGPTSVSLPGGDDGHMGTPYTMQYSATIEHQRWDTGFRVSYTGTSMRQGVYTRNINQPIADARLYIEKTVPYPKYPSVYFGDNGTSHSYHALTVHAERRMKSGIHYQGYWTWARDIEDASPEDAWNRRRERAVAEDTPMHRFSGNLVYELPFGKGKHWGSDAHWLLRGALGGWQISGIATLESGRYMSASWTGPDPTGTRYTTSSTRPVVTIRPDQIGNPNIDNPTVDHWFDPNAFAAPALGRFGTASRNTIRGTPIEVLHSSVSKYFSVRERLRLRTELIATNSLNHPNYNNPATNISTASSVATVTSVVDRNSKFDSAIPRVLQFHMRLEW
ncbi:MAG TPA: carboxypeptidase regulatory-like domain-containing protein [Bryobacteraceae bacterium]|nr:carboxypeptidase regulatory-like domain-containing protein [Bryobacteraceae bacterium]